MRRLEEGGRTSSSEEWSDMRARGEKGYVSMPWLAIDGESLSLKLTHVPRVIFLLLPVRHDRRRGGLGRLLQGRLPSRTDRRLLLRCPLHRRPQTWLGPLLHCLACKGRKVCPPLSLSPSF